MTTTTKRSQQMPDVSSKYGAPMGRAYLSSAYIPGTPSRCFRLRFVDGCYDDGGAYWGAPANVYCASAPGLLWFVRAKSRDGAKAKFKDEVPDITFKR